MARTRGAFPFSGSLEIHRTSPIDARLLVPTLAELTQEATWLDGGGIWLYNHIVVTVEDQDGQYMLVNYNPVTAPNAYKDSANWKRVDAAAAVTVVADNLTSTDATVALAATLGKVLNEKIELLKTDLASVYNYKGSVENYSDLPAADQVVGDTYNVVNANGTTPAGTNYAWNGTAWDALGGSVDLSGYYTKTETDDAIDAAKTAVEGQVTTLATTVGLHTEALNIINGNETTSGSLANTLKVAKEYTDDLLTLYVLKEAGKTLISTDKLTLIDTLDSRISTLETATEDLTTLRALVASNKSALEVLNGDENTTGSVLNTVSTALTWNEII